LVKIEIYLLTQKTSKFANAIGDQPHGAVSKLSVEKQKIGAAAGLTDLLLLTFIKELGQAT